MSNAAQFYIHNSVLWSSSGGQAFFHDGESPLNSSTGLNFVNDVFAGTFTTGSNTVINQVNAAPGWVNPAAGNYHLQTAPPSIAINSGTVIVPDGEPSVDIEGNVRIMGSRPDRGAFESGSINFDALTLTNLSDSRPGSIRQAISDANSSPTIAKSIKFDIRTPANVPISPAVIPLTTVLPAIASTVLIDGYTQPGATPNTSASAFNANLCVVVRSGVGSLATGFRVLANAGANASMRLRGLGLGGFSQPVRILGGASHVIASNQFAGSIGAVTLQGAGVNSVSIGVNATGSLIVGGVNPADRNLIGTASFGGVDIQAAVQSSTDKCQLASGVVSFTATDSLGNTSEIGTGLSIVPARVAVVYAIFKNGFE